VGAYNLYIVTGTSRGLGKEFATLLVNDGQKLISINRGDVDLSRPEALLLYLNQLKTIIHTGHRDANIVFVNNAATLGPIAPIHNLDELKIIEAINTNLTSSILLLRFLFSLENRWIYFNITTGSAQTKNKFLGIYGVTKLAVEEYLKFLGLEKENTKCCGLYNYDPHIIATDMNVVLKNNSYFKNEKIEKTTPKSAILAAEELYDFVKNTKDDKNFS